MKRFAALFLTAALILSLTACDSSDYKQAMSLYSEGKYAEAAAMFEALGDYENSTQMVLACRYGQGMTLLAQEQYEEALPIFEALEGYENSEGMLNKCNYGLAIQLYEEGDYTRALTLFAALGDYEQARSYCREAAWIALYAYIQENAHQHFGSTSMLTETHEKGNIYLITDDDDPDHVMLYCDSSSDFGFFESFNSIAISVSRDSFDGMYVLNSNSTTIAGGKTGETKTSASGNVDIRTVTAGTMLERSNFSYYCRDIYDDVTERTEPDALDLTDAQALMGTMLAGVTEILNDTALGITLADLGFLAVE